MLSLSRLRQEILAELDRRRAAAEKAEAAKPLPKPPGWYNSHAARKLRADENRVRNRAHRNHHRRLGLCSYLKCRGEHCPGGRK